jgi:hypothetical protein
MLVVWKDKREAQMISVLHDATMQESKAEGRVTGNKIMNLNVHWSAINT